MEEVPPDTLPKLNDVLMPLTAVMGLLALLLVGRWWTTIITERNCHLVCVCQQKEASESISLQIHGEDGRTQRALHRYCQPHKVSEHWWPRPDVRAWVRVRTRHRDSPGVRLRLWAWVRVRDRLGVRLRVRVRARLWAWARAWVRVRDRLGVRLGVQSSHTEMSACVQPQEGHCIQREAEAALQTTL